ncbi:MAG: glutamate-5-semialdehyde dehydrogenase [Clostridiales bacterium]|nr:glutamate-5-semialdehyde dehydrogenase [Roseburia sp.]MDD7636172.1 glutamate-5-semialdehyde dehydrogenase [Clostridiales bacterium]MDY4111619.1 glutamate-5-semialdehyde dehydrogenase [Roseburia sp.]
MELLEICKNAKEVSRQIGTLDTNTKNKALIAVADALVAQADAIIEANAKDLANAKENHMPDGLVDRLMLNHCRIEQIAEGLRQVADLEDPIGEVLSMKKRPNGLMIGKKRVPLGVVGIIYEARPNVTVDAFGLCFKTGNAVILKGGSDAIHSNIAIVSVIQNALLEESIPEKAVSLIEDTRRETAAEFMKMNDYVDVLIPRGGAGLIKAVVNQATIPVIETGTGNCHIFVDETADIDMAIDIIRNAKTQRIGVCNACESLVIHEKIVDELMPRLVRTLQESEVEVHADERCKMAALKEQPADSKPVRTELIKTATEEDWGTEYLDYMISAKTVSSIDEAIAHINRYNTGHSEAIVTNHYAHAEQFLNEIDAACVYVNASTRFSDGFEFGFGAEIGISTQKLHARGPMGLEALTSTKYIIYGNGQIRE